MNSEENYKVLIRQAQALTEDERMVIPNLANTAALLGNNLPDINWAGYYLLTEGILILGPFWGQPACIRIPMGKGVCGTCVAEDQAQVVPDVHAFPGHIACDSRSRSEIVIPLHAGGRVVGVLDIDSPEPGRFDETDRKYLTEFAAVLERNCDWESE